MPKNRAQFKAELIDLAEDILLETNAETAKEDYNERLSTLVDDYIDSITITIPTGAIIVVGPMGTSTNTAPIVLNGVVT